MQRSRNLISIWFFIGVLLLIYGVAILGAGLMDRNRARCTRCCTGRIACANLVGCAAADYRSGLHAQVLTLETEVD